MYYSFNLQFLLQHSMVYFLKCRHSNRPLYCNSFYITVLISYYILNLQLLTDKRCRASFHAFICHLYIFFGEISVQILRPLNIFFVFSLKNCKKSLYIADKSFCLLSVLQIFLPGPGLSLSFFNCVFGKPNFLNCEEAHPT